MKDYGELAGTFVGILLQDGVIQSTPWVRGGQQQQQVVVSSELKLCRKVDLRLYCFLLVSTYRYHTVRLFIIGRIVLYTCHYYPNGSSQSGIRIEERILLDPSTTGNVQNESESQVIGTFLRFLFDCLLE